MQWCSKDLQYGHLHERTFKYIIGCCYDKSASPKSFEKYFIFLFGFTMSIRKPISVTHQKSKCSWQQLTLKT